VLPEIKKLLELQQIDERVADANARLTRLAADTKQLEARIEAQRVSVQASKDALTQLQHESRMQNLEVDELDMQIREYQKRLDEGIISFKEMEDLRAKIASERKRISQLEDEALTMMDAVETRISEQKDAEENASEGEAALRAQIADKGNEREETQARLSGLAQERANVIEGIPSYLVTQYETLHAKLATPVAEIQGGICSGCKLRVSDNSTERARSEMSVVTCEHCSRILYTS